MERTEVPEAFAAALQAGGEQLVAELRLLDAMPQVKLTNSSVFDRAKPPGSNAQKRGVICALRCCGGQLDQKCNDKLGTDACPTHADAARLLRAKVTTRHGSVECVERAQQARAAEGAPMNE